MPSSSGKQHSARVPMMTITTTSKNWELTPLPLLLRTMGYLDNATLMRMCLVCQHIRDLIWNGQGMENKLIRIFELRSLARKKDIDDDDVYRHSRMLRCSRFRHFSSNMDRYFNDPTKHRLLRQYQEFKIAHGDAYHFDNGFDFYNRDELEQRTQNLSLAGILFLNAASPVRVTLSCGLLTAISRMVPNLQELNLSNVNMALDILVDFNSGNCPQLEKITWNFSTTHDEPKEYCHYADATGKEYLRYADANGWWLEEITNLKELYLDNCLFNFLKNINEHNNQAWEQYGFVTEYDGMSDLHNHPDIFFFSKVRHLPLERLSVRNMKYIGHTADAVHLFTDPNGLSAVRDTIPQNILIKFVRNAPLTLVWFRSDLSAANIRMLQLERPGIEFVT